jgi:hypothetical protein
MQPPIETSTASGRPAASPLDLPVEAQPKKTAAILVIWPARIRGRLCPSARSPPCLTACRSAGGSPAARQSTCSSAPPPAHTKTSTLPLRPDQLTVQAHLDGWDLRVAHDDRLTPWAPGQLLAASEHGIWARPNPASPWRLELLVDDVSDGDWVDRRNPVVRGPLDRLGRTTATGLPYLRPEVVLLYKAKRPRAADEHDAAVAIPRLSGSERAWLAAAIARDRPDHHWLPLLAHQERALASGT